MKYPLFILFLFFYLILPGQLSTLYGQELEPRTLTNLPRGLNFFAAGYAYASGNTLLDPSLPLDDFNGSINTIVLAYARSIDFMGKSGKIDAVLPIAGGDYTGVFEGEEFTDSYTGLGDLRVRAAINITGAPSLDREEFKAYTQTLVSGLAIQLIIPTGNYKKEQLPNLGSNRFVLRLNYGVSYTINQWVLEGRAGVWFFNENPAFLGDNTLRQNPLWVLKGNLIRSLKKEGMWMAFSVGYGYGAQSFINGISRDALVSQLRLALNFTLPLNSNHILNFTVGSGIRFKQGSDFDVFGMSYRFRWADKAGSK